MRDLWWDAYQNRGTCYECDGCMRCETLREYHDEWDNDWEEDYGEDEY